MAGVVCGRCVLNTLHKNRNFRFPNYLRLLASQVGRSAHLAASSFQHFSISAFQKFRFSSSVPHTSFQTFLREADNVVAVLCERRCHGEAPKHRAVIGGRRSSLNAKIVMAIISNRRTTQSPI